MRTVIKNESGSKAVAITGGDGCYSASYLANCSGWHNDCPSDFTMQQRKTFTTLQRAAAWALKQVN